MDKYFGTSSLPNRQMNFKKAASMIIKKEHGFSLPPLAEESGATPLPGEQNVDASPRSVASPTVKIASIVNALRPSSKTPAPSRAFSRAASRVNTSMSLARPST